MNGYCRTLDCFFGAQFDPGADADEAWLAVQVYRDGNPIVHGRFRTEGDAEACARDERDEQIRDNGQFGVGA